MALRGLARQQRSLSCPLQAPACSPGLLQGQATPSPCRWSVTPLRVTCDPGAVPWLHTHSCCAESALFQGLILNPCFSHPTQACSSFLFVDIFFPPHFLQLPALLSRLINYFTSASTSPYTALAEEIQCASPAHLFPLISLQIKQLTHSLQSPLFLVFSMLFSGKQIQQDKIVLQPAHRGCRHREILHKVLDCSVFTLTIIWIPNLSNNDFWAWNSINQPGIAVLRAG